MLGSLLLLTACASADTVAPPPSGRGTGATGNEGAGPPPGRQLLLQPGSSGISARTDGPCAIVVAFTGSPPSEGWDLPAYTARLEAAGRDELRLVIERHHPGVFIRLGFPYSLRATAAEPLAGRRIVDEESRELHLADGSALLRLGRLPAGWQALPESEPSGDTVAWTLPLSGPDGATGWLQQGALAVAEPGSKVFGYEEIAHPQVRGARGTLVSYTDEAPGNHVLSWNQDGVGFALQVVGPLPDPSVLVDIADGLVGPG